MDVLEQISKQMADRADATRVLLVQIESVHPVEFRHGKGWRIRASAFKRARAAVPDGFVYCDGAQHLGDDPPAIGQSLINWMALASRRASNTCKSTILVPCGNWHAFCFRNGRSRGD